MSRNEIEEFLIQLFDSTRYAFNIPVMIETNDKKYETGIIIRNGNILLTIDRDKIPISDIISIQRKNP